MKKRIMVFWILLLILLIPSVKAFCPPFFAKISNIENAPECLIIEETRGCGGEVHIANYCSEEFYFYDKEGNLDENFVLINDEKWNKNYQQYQELKIETGKEYRGFDYRDEPNFWQDCSLLYDRVVPEKNKIIINGIDMCNWEEWGNVESGTIVKEWSIKLLDKEQSKNITIIGKTVYEKLSEPYKIFLSIAVIFLAISIICFISRKKKEIFQISFWLCLVFALIFLFFAWLLTKIIG